MVGHLVRRRRVDLRGPPAGRRSTPWSWPRLAALLTCAAVVALLEVIMSGCGERRSPGAPTLGAPGTVPADPMSDPSGPDAAPHGEVVLAFAGDMHFERHLARLLDEPRGALGPIAGTLSAADLTMVNLESAITDRGAPEAKELEDPRRRYHFRTSPASLEVLAAAGIDLVTMANNHGADFGPIGLTDTFRAIRNGPIPVIGIGPDQEAAFAPHRVSIRGTEVAFLAADASMREGASDVWAAGPDNPGVAAARSTRPSALLRAVRSAARTSDVVVVYLHWGAELQACPTGRQRATARALADAGADVIVGTHAHVPLGSGWLGDTYVSYGLGNFLWYHDRRPESGVLQVRIRDGVVVGGDWAPAEIQPDGRPLPLAGEARDAAVRQWRGLRECAALAEAPARTPALGPPAAAGH
jgi:poly-gamma-glutamate synthesis protein (capsule biosynthesis protein)